MAFGCQVNLIFGFTFAGEIFKIAKKRWLSGSTKVGIKAGTKT
jgi:hypothetical protein